MRLKAAVPYELMQGPLLEHSQAIGVRTPSPHPDLQRAQVEGPLGVKRYPL